MNRWSRFTDECMSDELFFILLAPFWSPPTPEVNTGLYSCKLVADAVRWGTVGSHHVVHCLISFFVFCSLLRFLNLCQRQLSCIDLLALMRFKKDCFPELRRKRLKIRTLQHRQHCRSSICAGLTFTLPFSGFYSLSMFYSILSY